MLTIVSVLRSGGEYTPAHVVALRDAVVAHLPAVHSFVCLTDVDVPGVECRPLTHEWPGWWAKLNLWAPGLLTGRCVYLDLDTVIVGDLSDLAGYAGEFAMLSDLLRPERPASGVMAWRAGCEQGAAIWDAFMRDPNGHMHHHQGGGDQAFIASIVFGREDRLQDHAPGQIVSFKRHCTVDGPPDSSRLVCFHGRPKADDFPVGHWARGRLP